MEEEESSLIKKKIEAQVANSEVLDSNYYDFQYEKNLNLTKLSSDFILIYLEKDTFK